jgi:hypothetical protein
MALSADRTYDSNSAVNIGDNRRRGNVQLGWSHLIGTHSSYDAGLDTMLYGDNDDAFPGGLRLSQDPTYRLQLRANWRRAPSFQTSIGYEGSFGGTQSPSGALNGQKTEEQRLRATASYFITPALQGLLELNHDTNVVGRWVQAEFRRDGACSLWILALTGKSSNEQNGILDVRSGCLAAESLPVADGNQHRATSPGDVEFVTNA